MSEQRLRFAIRKTNSHNNRKMPTISIIVWKTINMSYAFIWVLSSFLFHLSEIFHKEYYVIGGNAIRMCMLTKLILWNWCFRAAFCHNLCLYSSSFISVFIFFILYYSFLPNFVLAKSLNEGLQKNSIIYQKHIYSYKFHDGISSKWLD